MSGKTSADTKRVLELIQGGMKPREACREVGIAYSTLYRNAWYRTHYIESSKNEHPR